MFLTDLDAGTPAVDEPARSAVRSGWTGTRRCSAGSSPGSRSAARRRCRSPARTRSASSRGSRSGIAGRGRRGRRGAPARRRRHARDHPDRDHGAERDRERRTCAGGRRSRRPRRRRPVHRRLADGVRRRRAVGAERLRRPADRGRDGGRGDAAVLGRRGRGVDRRAARRPCRTRASRPARSTRPRYQVALLAGLGLRGRVAVEAHALSLAAAAVLPDPHDVGTALRGLRAVKTADELATHAPGDLDLRRGPGRRPQRRRAGVTELTAWNGIPARWRRAAGERLPLLCDLVSGPRSAEVGGYPGERVTAEGDLVICDLVPRHRRHVRRLVLDDRGRRAAGRRRATRTPAPSTCSSSCWRRCGPGRVAGDLDRARPLDGPRLPAPHRPRHRLLRPRGAAASCPTRRPCWSRHDRRARARHLSRPVGPARRAGLPGHRRPAARCCRSTRWDCETRRDEWWS